MGKHSIENNETVVYLTENALLELAELVNAQNKRNKSADVLNIPTIDIDPMDEGWYSLSHQKGVSVSVEYDPDTSDMDTFTRDTYVAVIKVRK